MSMVPPDDADRSGILLEGRYITISESVAFCEGVVGGVVDSFASTGVVGAMAGILL